jgi:hypothetical protein
MGKYICELTTDLKNNKMIAKEFLEEFNINFQGIQIIFNNTVLSIPSLLF